MHSQHSIQRSPNCLLLIAGLLSSLLLLGGCSHSAAEQKVYAQYQVMQQQCASLQDEHRDMCLANAEERKVEDLAEARHPSTMHFAFLDTGETVASN